MCRPSQTPHLAMSSSYVTGHAGLGLETTTRVAFESKGISKLTQRVVVFHLRRSSHLSYTSYVISQSQAQPYRTGALQTEHFLSLALPNFLCSASAPEASWLSPGISTSLKPHIHPYSMCATDTFPRVTTATIQIMNDDSPRD